MQNNTEEMIQQEIQPSEVEIYDTFDKLNLKDNLLRGIYTYGFEQPSNIQQKSIVPIIQRHDLIAQAPSGTGKTGSFTIGVLQVIDETVQKIQGILIAPTRELAAQIHSVISSLGTHMKVKSCLAIGGVHISENMTDLKTSHVLVGTPGRICDLMEQKAFDMRHIKIIVMDEADELLRQDFIKQIKKIIEKVPRETQICLFSATLPDDLLQITTKFLNNPVKILVEAEKLSLEGIKQYYVDVEREQYKFDTLCDLYRSLKISQSIIFVNTIDKCIYLYDRLTENNHTVSLIHGQLTPEERNNVMKQFRLGNCRILLATDILARGIDVQHVNMVINYDLPNKIESYLHRIGRSGRYGRKGTAINFITDKSNRQMTEITRAYNINVEPLPNDVSNL
jgi:translation initiation factor 4A